jgi:hypothetical protein
LTKKNLEKEQQDGKWLLEKLNYLPLAITLEQGPISMSIKRSSKEYFVANSKLKRTRT